MITKMKPVKIHFFHSKLKRVVFSRHSVFITRRITELHKAHKKWALHVILRKANSILFLRIFPFFWLSKNATNYLNLTNKVNLFEGSIWIVYDFGYCMNRTQWNNKWFCLLFNGHFSKNNTHAHQPLSSQIKTTEMRSSNRIIRSSKEWFCFSRFRQSHGNNWVAPKPHIHTAHLQFWQRQMGSSLFMFILCVISICVWFDFQLIGLSCILLHFTFPFHVSHFTVHFDTFFGPQHVVTFHLLCTRCILISPFSFVRIRQFCSTSHLHCLTAFPMSVSIFVSFCPFFFFCVLHSNARTSDWWPKPNWSLFVDVNLSGCCMFTWFKRLLCQIFYLVAHKTIAFSLAIDICLVLILIEKQRSRREYHTCDHRNSFAKWKRLRSECILITSFKYCVCFHSLSQIANFKRFCFLDQVND